MILGMSVATFTLLHVLVSLIAIAIGGVVVIEMLRSRLLSGLTALFLATTVLTSASGFLFHSKSFGAPHVVGLLSLAVLAVALLALYARHLAGNWRAVYVVGALIALYLNVFVGVVQAFQKIAFLRALAPSQTEPPFLVAQALVLILFIWLGVAAAKRFHPGVPADPNISMPVGVR